MKNKYFGTDGIRGTVNKCLSHFEKTEPKGEFVICIEGLKS